MGPRLERDQWAQWTTRSRFVLRDDLPHRGAEGCVRVLWFFYCGGWVPLPDRVVS